MNLEIERKFLITNTNFKKESYQKKYIQQGFLNSDKNRVVRVRIIEEKAYLTIKGISDKSGTSRFEWEKEISVQEAKVLMNLCEKGVIEKYRYFHKLENHVFEIDEFLGVNEGLVIAEVELKNKNEVFIKPSYLGKEVTGDEKYYNSNLSKVPFKDWA
tara:strand:+ start:76932 stop:77405 length:474 start_codon:yes stop_codon:yes gene_type:complete